MFIGRKQELQVFDRLYRTDHFECMVLYGRRRVGKTALLRTFIEGKAAIYFAGVESNERQNLENFSRAILESVKGSPAGATLTSFQSGLEFVFQRAEQERMVLIIDEYPYVARSSPSLASTLQVLIDNYRDRSRLKLILCGSSMSYMEDEVLAYKSPLYGRGTAQMKLEPVDFFEACAFFPHFAAEDKAIAYGLAGGTPQYLLQIDDQLSVEENLKRMYLDPSSFLFEEPVNLLKQEVREPAIYNAIMTAVANGANRLGEIADRIGEETNTCSTYLKNMIALESIEKETPYGEKAAKKTLYRIVDPMFYFWYHFIPENSSLIARGAAELAYQRISSQLNDYMGHIFEEICKQYLWRQLLAGQSPVLFVSLGRWWGSDPVTRRQEEIDIVGAQDKDVALFAECKWRNELTDAGVLTTLVRRSRLLPYSKAYYYLFSKSGFTEGCIRMADELGNVTLVSFPEMFGKEV